MSYCIYIYAPTSYILTDSRTFVWVWVSYEPIYDSLNDIRSNKKYESSSRTKANGLFLKIRSLDFLVAILFMKNIRNKTKSMVDTLQKEQLDVSGAIKVMESTQNMLERIKNDTDGQKNQIDGALNFANSLGVNGVEEFNKIHRIRKKTIRYEDSHTPDTSSSSDENTIHSYYSKEMNTVLETMLSILDSKCKNIKSSFKPFHVVLDPNVEIQHYDTKEFMRQLK